MIYDYDDFRPEDHPDQEVQTIPDADVEFVSAKTFLQKCSTVTGDNLYDHLTDVLNKILAERPENVIDFFEEYSRKVKEKRFKPMTDHLEDIYVAPGRYTLAKKVMPLLRPLPDEGPAMDPEDEDLADMTRNDMLQLCYFFEQAGIGLPRSEMFYIMMSMRKLIRTEPLASIRFWGKINGLYRDYLVVETELKEEEYMKRNELEEIPPEPPPTADLGGGGDDVTAALENIAQTQEEEGEGEPRVPSKVPRQLPPAPQIQYEEPPEPPSEPSGVGVNKKVYYVCHEAGDTWIQLPDVTPKQIRVARQIKKSLTGMLGQEVITYPDFPGTEMNYLRAQIARISAGTQISPLGFYTFKEEGGEEEEEEEEEEEAPGEAMKTTYMENRKFEPIPIRDLVDGSMSFWVHHTLYILPQGRTSWWNPNPPEGEEMDEELGEEEGGKPAIAGPEPETGPPLLTPLSEDASVEAVPPWSVRTSSGLLQDYAIAIVRSNLWPGAYCFATQGKIFQNIYIGFGHKYMAHNFTPVPLPFVQQDYPLGPEIMEVIDPTGAEEEQWRIDHLPKPPPLKEEGEGEEPEEAEEEEEDD